MLAHGIVTEHAHRAAVGVKKAAHDANGRRFSGAVGADETEHLAAAHVERQPGKRLGRAVSLDDVLEVNGWRHGRASSASTGIPGLSTPSRLSTLTLMR